MTLPRSQMRGTHIRTRETSPRAPYTPGAVAAPDPKVFPDVRLRV